jgi:hypothetical protein
VYGRLGSDVDRGREWSEGFEDVVDVADEHSAVADELMAAGAGETVDGARDCEDFASLFVGVAGSVEGADCADASTRRTPSDIPLMMRFRWGKSPGRICWLSGISLMRAPCWVISPASDWFSGG